MDEMSELRAMRADIPVPGPEQLASTETRLTAAMASASPPGAGRVTSIRAWRWLPRPAIRVAVAAAAVVAMAVGAILAGLVGEAGLDGGGGGTTAVAEQLPKLQLAAAARATGETSFAFKVRETRRDGPVFEGAYDPVGKRGFMATTNQHGKGFEERFVDGRAYAIRTVDGKPVEVKQVHREFLGFTHLPGVTVDPTNMLNALAKAGTVDKARSTGGVDTYTFQYEQHAPTADPAPSTASAPARATPAPTSARPDTDRQTFSMSGKVEVRSGKVSSVTYRMGPGAYRTMGEGFDTIIEFSNYGMPVDVDIPNI